MSDSGRLQKQISALGDVELVRMLTVDAAAHPADALDIARAEAESRGLPIDARFAAADSEGTASREERCQPYEAGGIAIACRHCGNGTFESRQVLLNTRGLTFVNLDWLNRSATALICGKCGLIQLFAEPPTPSASR